MDHVGREGDGFVVALEAFSWDWAERGMCRSLICCLLQRGGRVSGGRPFVVFQILGPLSLQYTEARDQVNSWQFY